jgi:predicted TPR repeat methyltransferase
MKTGQLQQAQSYYLKALELMPQDAQILFNLAVMSAQQGRAQEAQYFYLRLLQYQPTHAAAHYNLALLYLTLKDKKAALLHLRETKQIEPGHASACHLLASLNQDENVQHVPKEHVSHLFDAYADHYEAHLLQELHYQVPQYFAKILETLPQREDANWNCLDLGCGSGLCAPAVKKRAAFLTGVDLSAKMLKLAHEKNLYDRLVQKDLESFLLEEQAHYDLIMAGDTLVYLGDLHSLFKSVYQALKPRGLFLFNTESEPQWGYHLSESGRFQHHQTYLEQMAKAQDFAILQYHYIVLRTQEAHAVMGHLYLLQALKK